MESGKWKEAVAERLLSDYKNHAGLVGNDPRAVQEARSKKQEARKTPCKGCRERPPCRARSKKQEARKTYAEAVGNGPRAVPRPKRNTCKD